MNENDEVMRLTDLPPEELIKMSREQLHEGYKKVMKNMVVNFFWDAFSYVQTIRGDTNGVTEVEEFTSKWIDEHLKPAREDWHPGMGLDK